MVLSLTDAFQALQTGHNIDVNDRSALWPSPSRGETRTTHWNFFTSSMIDSAPMSPRRKPWGSHGNTATPNHIYPRKGLFSSATVTFLFFFTILCYAETDQGCICYELKMLLNIWRLHPPACGTAAAGWMGCKNSPRRREDVALVGEERLQLLF